MNIGPTTVEDTSNQIQCIAAMLCLLNASGAPVNRDIPIYKRYYEILNMGLGEMWPHLIGTATTVLSGATMIQGQAATDGFMQLGVWCITKMNNGVQPMALWRWFYEYKAQKQAEQQPYPPPTEPQVPPMPMPESMPRQEPPPSIQSNQNLAIEYRGAHTLGANGEMFIVSHTRVHGLPQEFAFLASEHFNQEQISAHVRDRGENHG